MGKREERKKERKEMDGGEDQTTVVATFYRPVAVKEERRSIEKKESAVQRGGRRRRSPDCVASAGRCQELSANAQEQEAEERNGAHSVPCHCQELSPAQPSPLLDTWGVTSGPYSGSSLSKSLVDDVYLVVQILSMDNGLIIFSLKISFSPLF